MPAAGSAGLSVATALAAWAGAALRWLHVTAAVAWLGLLLYVVALDRRLKPRPGVPLPQGTAGEAWLVVEGGLYRVTGYRAAPVGLRERPAWFRWQAYATWGAGFGLLVLAYAGRGPRLTDPAVLPGWAAAGVGLGAILVGYLAYEALCRSRIGRDGRVLAVVGLMLLATLAWALATLLGARGAAVHLGALLGTCMVANVAHVIIPAQRRALAALADGREPDRQRLGEAARRSRHNALLALPTVLLMLGGHAPLAVESGWGWLGAVASAAVGHGTGVPAPRSVLVRTADRCRSRQVKPAPTAAAFPRRPRPSGACAGHRLFFGSRAVELRPPRSRPCGHGALRELLRCAPSCPCCSGSGQAITSLSAWACTSSGMPSSARKSSS